MLLQRLLGDSPQLADVVPQIGNDLPIPSVVPGRLVVLIEALEILCDREGRHWYVLASLKPIAVVVSRPDGVTAFGLDGNPTELGSEARALVENAS
ncbi:hypothetical protein [Thioalkalivibrio paradoxus]|uniref:Uncharacterized protein n=1 Tax=Thioalkalivibrio paradoxus ARh 1 TaxID=713585 RepID=W0DPD4_9GAMM|nr:hypothetical protein [Thioalkalivibrio paradoxus]AHF00317.1 hypothetical protein THITH_16855 [Thioalkalivibrio paradoxus ARh 1]